MAKSDNFDPYEVFRRSVERYGDLPALRIGDRTWTYAELDAHAASIAGWCDRNAPSGSRIAVHGRKELAAYAGILGILRSGRSYVPLHPDHPRARWQVVLESSGAAACVADPSSTRALGDLVDRPVLSNWDGERPADVRQGSEAYVMFTSGSTGGPKGVPISRSNVSAYLEHMLSHHRFTTGDRFTQLFALTFDLSVHDLFVCWGSGGCLCVPGEDSALRISSYIASNGITVWFSVPSAVALLRRMRALVPGAFPGLKHSFFCGEALSWDLAHAWSEAAPNSAITNLYGPTEATIAITSFDVRAAVAHASGTVPLGGPIGTNEVRVSGDEGISEGELWLAGPQVAQGYLGAAEATSRAFIHLPGDDAVWYRTGDRVRKDGDGILHFLGRLDDQVKVLGHRVEPAEVDFALAPLVPNGTVLTLATTLNGTTRLVTFIDTMMDTAPLVARLQEVLPPYMIPERIIAVDGFPTTGHGKVDRNALFKIADNG
ncbi:MAG: AMP-binding protein [Flavobacteriales bacterium]|nr:AMP-binding protein [Flavobacteriales bacterium]